MITIMMAIILAINLMVKSRWSMFMSMLTFAKTLMFMLITTVLL